MDPFAKKGMCWNDLKNQKRCLTSDFKKDCKNMSAGIVSVSPYDLETHTPVGVEESIYLFIFERFYRTAAISISFSSSFYLILNTEYFISLY